MNSAPTDRHISKNEFHYFAKIHTRWNDMDAMGHVNNATFLTYLETTRIGYLSSMAPGEKSFIIGSIKIDYLDQLSHPAMLTVGQKVVRLGNRSFDILGAIFRGDEEAPVAVSVTTVVSFDYASQKTVAVPDVIRERLEHDFRDV